MLTGVDEISDIKKNKKKLLESLCNLKSENSNTSIKCIDMQNFKLLYNEGIIFSDKIKL